MEKATFEKPVIGNEAALRRSWVTLLLAAAAVGTRGETLFLHHSFDRGLGVVDFGPPHATGKVEGNVRWVEEGVAGRAAGFDPGAGPGTLTVHLGEQALTSRWTLAFFLSIGMKEALVAPGDELLTVLDQHGDVLLRMDVSGNVSVHAPSGWSAGLPCLDALYWIDGETQHLAVAYDSDGSLVSRPRGVLTAYWQGRPYGAMLLDLGDRRPAALRFASGSLPIVMDELQIFAAALSQPALVELSRRPQSPPKDVMRRMGEWIRFYEECPFNVRRQQWKDQVKTSVTVEAESGTGGKVLSGWHSAMSSGNAHVELAAHESTDVPFDIREPGDYALALRYSLDRRLDPMWPVRSPQARTEWSDNAAAIEVLLDGQPLATERLYPTGITDGHTGDVDPWAWHALAEGRKFSLGAGQHVLTLRVVSALAELRLDALLIGKNLPPPPPHPRWVDAYRVSPAWWVAGKETTIQRSGLFRRERVDTYAITLRNRNDEPYTALVRLESDRLDRGQTATTDTTRIEMAPNEEKSFRIVFRSRAAAKGITGYVRVLLWNEDTAIPMEYRLWNVIPEAFHATRPHPRLLPTPDAERQRQFREWLKHRDSQALTPEIRQWAAGPDKSKLSAEYRVLAHWANLFPAPLLEDRLAILDMWMSMSEEQIASYLPQAASENAGYGLCWDKVNNHVAGCWAGPSFDYRTSPPAHIWKPEGNLDIVTQLWARGIKREEWTARGCPPFDRTDLPIVEGQWSRERDPDVFSGLRSLRWSMITGLPYGGMGYQSADMPRDSGIPLVAEAYYLTGDPAFAQQAYRMARAFARAYTARPRQFLFRLYREDRGWWGSRWGNRYMSGMGERVIQRLGTIVLDLCWDGLTESQRNEIEHNVFRFGMYETTYGPLWDDPDKAIKVNYEDPPGFVPAGLVLGDPGPRRGLHDFFRLVNKMVCSDGVHICSIGTYGGPRMYLKFMKMLHDLGVDVKAGNPALRNAFLAYPRLVFSCGSVQPMDDGGGGQELLGLWPTFGSPDAEQYEWGYALFGDPLFPMMADFLTQLGHAAYHEKRPHERANNIRRFYARHAEGLAGEDGRFPLAQIWPPVFVAPDKGMAMLRNRVASDPLDWIEVLFDYGKYGGRFHGHPSKLSILTAYNGQIGSQDFGDLTRNATEGNNDWFMGGYSHNTCLLYTSPSPRDS